MEKTKKRRRAQTRRFKFNTANEMFRFIELYGDLFVPYADSTIQICANTERNAINMSKGYSMGNNWWLKNDPFSLAVFIEPEGLEEILNSNLFEKKPLAPIASRQYYYEYKEPN